MKKGAERDVLCPLWLSRVSCLWASSSIRFRMVQVVMGSTMYLTTRSPTSRVPYPIFPASMLLTSF